VASLVKASMEFNTR